jgi:hypothetical protein
MKHKSIFSLLFFLMGVGIATTSCEDMLTPDLTRYTENFSGRDTVYFYNGILRNVQDMVEQNELLGDLRSDLVTTTKYTSDSISNIVKYENKRIDGEDQLLNRAAYYKVINQCNFYLAKVDTTAQKNNIKYMKREYAQVLNIRAWAYLQLVQTYGTVPFITKPVDNADTGWEKNPEKWATADNLLDLLKADLKTANGIEYANGYGYPDYGEYQTGNSNFKVNTKYLRFYSDLILGDLYLLHSANRQDYIEAAKSYYKFLRRYNNSTYNVTGGFATYSRYQLPNGTYQYTPNVDSWIGSGLNASSLGNENITIIPSAANNTFGRVLSRNVQIFGFDPSSRNSTSSDVNGGSVSTSGQVTISVNYRSRQVGPSNAYVNLCKTQSYSNTEYASGIASNITYFTGVGDARMYGTAPIVETKEGGRDENENRYIMKSAVPSSVDGSGLAHGASFKHFRSIYRVRQVWLRYAEAINRAGFPRLAFAVLRDGLDHQTLPTLTDSIKYINADSTKYHTVTYLDSTSVENTSRGVFYLGNDEMRRAQAEPEHSLFLPDFENKDNNEWLSNHGIHEQGCGASSVLDTIFSYKNVVAKRIEEEAKRTNSLTASVKRHIRNLRRYDVTVGDDTNTGTGDVEEDGEQKEPAPAEVNPLEVQAVETLIADECALETAYEGSRMFDLIRFARHMNNDASGVPGFTPTYGTTWLAWKIARRNENLKPYEDPTLYDGSLYTLLLDPNNWYIVSPKY